MKTCFVSAPPNVDLSTLQAVLHSRGYKVSFPFKLAPTGVDFRQALETAISSADLCLAVLSGDKDNSNVLLELGYILGLQKRVILLQDAQAPLPPYLQAMPIIRANLRDEKLLGQFLDQAISKIGISKQSGKKAKPTRAIAGRALELNARLRSHGANISGFELENLILEAFRDSGIQTLAENPSNDHGYDVAIWVDELQDRIGNPILVEVRKQITPKGARDLADKFIGTLAWMTARALIVIYLEGNEESISKVSRGVPLIFFIQVEALLEALQTKSLPALLWQQRNRMVHGV